MRRSGFSLIEIAVVLLLIAVVAAAVTLRAAGPLHRARARDVTGRIAAFDRLTRAYARQHDKPLRLNINLNRCEFSRSDEQGGRLGTPYALPAGWRIARLVVRGEEITAGAMAVSCSRLGYTPSYAILIEHESGRQKWLLWAGLTGEMVQVDDDKEITDIFAALGGRPDAR